MEEMSDGQFEKNEIASLKDRSDKILDRINSEFFFRELSFSCFIFFYIFSFGSPCSSCPVA